MGCICSSFASIFRVTGRVLQEVILMLADLLNILLGGLFSMLANMCDCFANWSPCCRPQNSGSYSTNPYSSNNAQKINNTNTNLLATSIAPPSSTNVPAAAAAAEPTEKQAIIKQGSSDTANLPTVPKITVQRPSTIADGRPATPHTLATPEGVAAAGTLGDSGLEGVQEQEEEETIPKKLKEMSKKRFSSPRSLAFRYFGRGKRATILPEAEDGVRDLEKGDGVEDGGETSKEG